MTPDTITLKANSIYPVRVAGKFLSILSCTAALAVELDNGGRVSAVAGSQFGDGTGFSKVTFVETSGADNIVAYTIGDAPSPGRPVSVQANAAIFLGINSGSYIFTNAAWSFPGSDGNGHTRKEIYIANFGLTGTGAASTALITVWVAGKGSPIAVVFPGTTLRIETNWDLLLFASPANNPSSVSGTLQGCVMENLYSKPIQSDQ